MDLNYNFENGKKIITNLEIINEHINCCSTQFLLCSCWEKFYIKEENEEKKFDIRSLDNVISVLNKLSLGYKKLEDKNSLSLDLEKENECLKSRIQELENILKERKDGKTFVITIPNYSIIRKDLGQMSYTKDKVEIDEYRFGFAFCPMGYSNHFSFFIYQIEYKPVTISLTVSIRYEGNIIVSKNMDAEFNGFKHKFSQFGWNSFINSSCIYSYLKDDTLELECVIKVLKKGI